MRRRILRYEVPIDDVAHEVKLTGGRPVSVAAAGKNVEFWAEHIDGLPPTRWLLRVFGTGHELPENAIYLGTCPRTTMGLVWHLYALMAAG